MLTKAQLQNIIDTIITGYKPEQIFLFGSYASGNASADSDVDLLIVKNSKDSFFTRVRNVRKLFVRQPAPMDILVFTEKEMENEKENINSIINIVSKEGKLVYERKL